MSSWHWENPLAGVSEFDRGDWLDIAQRLALMLAVGLMGMALGVQVASMHAIGEFCSGLVLASADRGCPGYVRAMQAWMGRTFYVGAALLVVAAGSEVVWDG